MQFDETFDFTHDAATIIRMFADKDYFINKYAQMSRKAPELLEVQSDAGHFSITVRHALDASKLNFPDIIKKRAGNSIMLHQTDAWDLKARHGRIDIDIERMPVTIVVDMRLEEADSGARLHLAFDIEANIPLFGSKIEKALAGPITKRMHDDLRLTDQMAADY